MPREMEEMYDPSFSFKLTQCCFRCFLQREMEEMYDASRERHAGLAGQLDR